MKTKTQFIATLLLFLLSTALLHAQELKPRVTWGKEFEAPRRSSLNDIVGFDKSGIYAIKERYGFTSSTRRFTLEHYDPTFKPTRSFDLDLKHDGKDALLEMVLQLHNKLYLFSSVRDTRVDKNMLFVQEINKSTLEPMPNARQIAEIDFTGKSSSNSGGFAIKVSRDSSKVMVFYSLPYAKNEPESFGFQVLDDTMTPLWNKEVKLPYADGLFTIESTRVDNEGDVYLLAVIYKDKRKSKRHGLPNYTYNVFAFLNKGTEAKEYPISLEDRFLTDMQIEILNNKNLICAGFYSEKGTNSIRGSYFLTVDAATKEIKTKSFKEFGIDFITQNMKEGEADRARRKEKNGDENEMLEYDLDKLLVGKDGSAMLIGEQYYMTTSTSNMMMNGMMQNYTTYHYNYNDIIVVKIDPAGQISWAEKIAKRQHTIDDGGFYSSYTMSIVKGRLCFIFNDNRKNATYTGTGKVYNYSPASRNENSMIMLVSIDQQGKQVREPLFGALDMEVTTRPKVCEQISSTQVILFGQRKKTQQFARVEFGE
ncbi:hypothetical protein [Chryseolinea lacunae]|uniref:Uncharacterized protein n=1 Tax=Chryseolinea lacunae TaxID=2801331 RepID=A0ABS1KX00_9BACT|nr:hypothetical protein [Chryseolinea lacunae]MBL0743828.1 hypothetical protein [Chryseolinea lacunae]